MITMRQALAAGGLAACLIVPAAAMAGTHGAFQIAQAATMPKASDTDVNKLIGRNVMNAQNEKIGDINSIYVDKDGKVDSVIVGVGGFLGVGEREVAIKWSSISVPPTGDKVSTNLTKDQLKTMPEFKYKNSTYKGTVFHDVM